jgi:hypothetical protein
VFYLTGDFQGADDALEDRYVTAEAVRLRPPVDVDSLDGELGEILLRSRQRLHRVAAQPHLPALRPIQSMRVRQVHLGEPDRDQQRIDAAEMGSLLDVNGLGGPVQGVPKPRGGLNPPAAAVAGAHGDVSYSMDDPAEPVAEESSGGRPEAVIDGIETHRLRHERLVSGASSRPRHAPSWCCRRENGSLIADRARVAAAQSPLRPVGSVADWLIHVIVPDTVDSSWSRTVNGSTSTHASERTALAAISLPDSNTPGTPPLRGRFTAIPGDGTPPEPVPVSRRSGPGWPDPDRDPPPTERNFLIPIWPPARTPHRRDRAAARRRRAGCGANGFRRVRPANVFKVC